MILSVSECIEAFKREHPDLYPIWYVEDGGAYLFNCLKRGVSRDEAMSSFYVADPTDGRIYGPVPVMGILDNEELAKKLENPHMIDGEDQLLEHSSMGNRVGRYSVRRKGSLIIMDGTVLEMMDVYDDLDQHIQESNYDVRCFGFDPYNARAFVERWIRENGEFGVEKVIQGAKTESVPLGELKKLSSERMLIFDQEMMTFAMQNTVAIEDTNGNRKLSKKRYDEKIDSVAAMLDAYVAYKLNTDTFE